MIDKFSNILIVKTTSDKKEVLEKIAENLLLNKLSACVSIIDNVSSLYIWNKRIQKSKEYIMLIKTNKEKEKEVYDGIGLYHNYDLPEILSINISNSEKIYTNWINNNLK